MKGPANMPEKNLVSIHKDEVTGLVRIDGVEPHVGGLGEGGRFVSHTKPGEGTDLIKVQLVVGSEDVDVVPHVCIVVV